jgi:3alpha(or 20beta)-hydroxysteroid dehydrogenase
MKLGLEGRVGIVTGAARGIGSAIARSFVEAGMDVILVDRRDELGRAVANELGPHAVFVAADVTQAGDWDRIGERAHSRFGGVDVLVNNAGIIKVAPLQSTDEDMFRRVLDTNLLSVFLGMRAVVNAMETRGGGSIINLASPQGLEGRAGMAAYSASKFGVRGLTRTAAIELGPKGIRVNCVVPGPIRTAMTQRKGWSDADYAKAYGGYPLKRMGNPVEIARLVTFLASDAASFCTGADYLADGGLLAGKTDHG